MAAIERLDLANADIAALLVISSLLAVSTCTALRVRIDSERTRSPQHRNQTRGGPFRVGPNARLYNVGALIAGLSIASNYAYSNGSIVGSAVLWPAVFGVLALCSSRLSTERYREAIATFCVANMAAPFLSVTVAYFGKNSSESLGLGGTALLGSVTGIVSTCSGLAAFRAIRPPRKPGEPSNFVRVLLALAAGTLVDSVIYEGVTTSVKERSLDAITFTPGLFGLKVASVWLFLLAHRAFDLLGKRTWRDRIRVRPAADGHIDVIAPFEQLADTQLRRVIAEELSRLGLSSNHTPAFAHLSWDPNAADVDTYPQDLIEQNTGAVATLDPSVPKSRRLLRNAAGAIRRRQNAKRRRKETAVSQKPTDERTVKSAKAHDAAPTSPYSVARDFLSKNPGTEGETVLVAGGRVLEGRTIHDDELMDIWAQYMSKYPDREIHIIPLRNEPLPPRDFRHPFPR